MKKPVFLFILTLLFACAEQKIPEPTTATVSGTIIKPLSDRIMIRGIHTGMEAILDTAGSFSFNIEMKKPGFYLLSHGGEVVHLYISPGDDISFNTETTNFYESLEYSGKGAKPNTYLAEKHLINKKITKDPAESYMMDEQEFRNYIDTVMDVNLSHLEEFFSKDRKKYADFIAAEKSRLEYDRASILIAYPSYHSHYSEETGYKPSKGYFDFLEDMELNNASMLDLQEFRSFSEIYVNHKAQERLKKDKTLLSFEHPFYVSVFEVIGEEVYQPRIRTFLYQEYLLDLLNKEPVKKSDKLLRVFYEETEDSLAISKIESAMKSWEGLHQGMPAPGFSYPDINGDTTSLDDFYGKYVYVDIWATWCRPCIMEIPHLEALQDEYRGRNIVIVSISVDADKSAWERMVKEKNPGGLQLYASNKGEDNIIKNYNIRSIPRFILIDREGKIVDVNAPKPSGPIRNMLSSLEGI